uniref:Uncharacterized protein n=2 Tax=Lygus hesperus TaxID=30085 RepID=A0A146LVC8_LYGHE
MDLCQVPNDETSRDEGNWNHIQPIEICNTNNHASLSHVCWCENIDALSLYTWCNGSEELQRWDLRIPVRGTAKIPAHHMTYNIAAPFPITHVFSHPITLERRVNKKLCETLHRGTYTLLCTTNFDRVVYLSWGAAIPTTQCTVSTTVHEYLLAVFESLWSYTNASLLTSLRRLSVNTGRDNVPREVFLQLIQRLQALYLQWECVGEDLHLHVDHTRNCFALDGYVCTERAVKCGTEMEVETERNRKQWQGGGGGLQYTLWRPPPALHPQTRTLNLQENRRVCEQWLQAQGLVLQLYDEEVRILRALHPTHQGVSEVDPQLQKFQKGAQTALRDACAELFVWSWMEYENRVVWEPLDAIAHNDRRSSNQAFAGLFQLVYDSTTHSSQRQLIVERLTAHHSKVCCVEKFTDCRCIHNRIVDDLQSLHHTELCARWGAWIVEAVSCGSLGILPIVGLNTPAWRFVVQSYVNRTANVDVAAVIQSYTPKHAACGDNFIQHHRHLLNMQLRYTQRSEFDVEFCKKTKWYPTESNSRAIWYCVKCKKK